MFLVIDMHASANWNCTDGTCSWFNLERGGQSSISFPELCIYSSTEHIENVFYWRNIIYLGLWRTTQQKQKDIETSRLDVIPGWVSWEHSEGGESPPSTSWPHFFLGSPGYWAGNRFCWLVLYFSIHQYHR